MPRANRHYIPGCVWHITHRCHKQEFLLKFAHDRRRYLYWLYEAKKRFGLKILNYIVTSNHIHLLVLDGGQEAIPQSLQLIAGRTAQEFNLRKSRKGAFWEDRYHATTIESDHHLHRCIIMFGHKNLRAEAGGAGGEVDRFVNFSDPSSLDHYLQVKQPFAMQGAEKNLVWMHGYNVNPTEARGTYAEVFKRFFHAGLMGRFYGVSWFGDPSGHFANPTAPFSPHYHQAAVNAFATAGNFAGFVGSLPGVTSIAAHSLGNLVAGEAVQKGLSVANYFAVDAAVALEAYGDIPRDAEGQVSLNSDLVNVEDWPDYIAAGQTRLLASEWHRLFGDGPEPLAAPPVYPPASPPSDNRASLTWRGRLANVPGLNVYNFFSSTEDVLRTYPGDDLVWDGAGANLGMYSWVKC